MRIVKYKDRFCIIQPVVLKKQPEEYLNGNLSNVILITYQVGDRVKYIAWIKISKRIYFRNWANEIVNTSNKNVTNRSFVFDVDLN